MAGIILLYCILLAFVQPGYAEDFGLSKQFGQLREFRVETLCESEKRQRETSERVESLLQTEEPSRAKASVYAFMEGSRLSSTFQNLIPNRGSLLRTLNAAGFNIARTPCGASFAGDISCPCMQSRLRNSFKDLKVKPQYARASTGSEITPIDQPHLRIEMERFLDQ